jgi:hypothetical protein
LPGVRRHARKDGYDVFFTDAIGPTVAAILRTLEEVGDPLVDLRVERPSLEERFLELTAAGAGMRATLHHAGFEFASGLRNRAMLLLLYLFPLGFYLVAGALMVGLNPGFRETIVPAMVVFALMAGCLLGLPDPIVTAREAGIYRSFKIHGVPAASILLLPGAATLLHLTVVAAIITATAPLLFGAPLPARRRLRARVRRGGRGPRRPRAADRGRVGQHAGRRSSGGSSCSCRR